MKLNLGSKVFLLLAIISIFSVSALACPDIVSLDETPRTSNMFSPELLWGLLIILLHMGIGLVHTWFKERKPKKVSPE